LALLQSTVTFLTFFTFNIRKHGHNHTRKHEGCAVSRKHTIESLPVSLQDSNAKRLQTSLDKTGSDAMNAAGDYSSAYCILHTDSEHSGHGMTFTIGRGNEIVCQAISLLADRIKGKSLEELVADWGKTWRYLVSD